MAGPFGGNMFMPMKSLGSSIGLPFLSQTEDKQLLFRVGKDGVKRLSGSEVIPQDDYAYWAQYYRLFDSAADVTSLIQVSDIRLALQNQPRNLQTLILILSHHLFTLLPSPLFPSPQASLSLRSQLQNATRAQHPQNPTKEALNCLRVLGRVLAVVYEVEADDLPSRAGSPSEGDGQGEAQDGGRAADDEDARLRRDFAWNVLWKRLPVAKRQNGEAQRESSEERDDATQFELGDHSDGEDDAAREWKDTPVRAKAAPSAAGSSSATAPHATAEDPLTQSVQSLKLQDPSAAEAEDDSLPSLADRLFSCTVDLLFCAGFTIPEGVRSGEQAGDKINYVIWERGVGSTVTIGSSVELDRNKTEVMRFLLVLLSSTIYTAPHRLPHSTNRPQRYLTHALERRLVLSLLCSWLNTSLASTGGGIGEHMPYNHLLLKLGEDRRTLVKMSLMCLLVALDFQTANEDCAETPAIESGAAPAQWTEPAARKDGNAFRYFVSKLHRKDDFQFILGGILSILGDFTAVTTSLLPGSKKPVPYIMETCMLFWKLVDLNKRFRSYIHESGKMVDVIGYILVCCLELKDNPAHHGFLRMLSYILQSLSSDREFAASLNKPQNLAIPAKWAVQGTTGDFLIVSMYSIATTSNLNPLFQPLTITVANVAPYLKGIGVQASTRLLQLFKAFSAPHFLLADEGHPRLVYYLLETFNGILYHQLDENPNLVYSILRSHQDFQALATFTLASGLQEVQRRLLARAMAAAAVKSPEKSDDRLWDTNLPAEKAALLLRHEEDKEEVDISTPSSLGSLRPPRGLTTAPLHTPGEAEEDPLATPQVNADRQKAAPKSEKAKGKMRERTESVSTITANPELERLAAAGIGPSGYVPTQEWVSSWQKNLPLDPVLIATSDLLPRVQELQTATSPAPSRAVFNYLRGASLTEVLPKTSPHAPRRFQWSVASSIWLTSLLWGDIYVAMLPNFSGTNVKLFGVRQAALSRRDQAIQNVSNKVLSFVGAYAPPGVATETSFTV